MFKNLFVSLRRQVRFTPKPVQKVVTAPGVYIEEAPVAPRSIAGVNLSAAAFVGLAAQGPIGTVVAISTPAEFDTTYGASGTGQLGAAVRAFFANGGRRLYILRVAKLPADAIATRTALASLDGLDDVGLLALPGVTMPEVLQAAARYCEMRRHILLVADCPVLASAADARAHAKALVGSHVALYYPWLHMHADPEAIAPSGAVAGLLARQEITGQIAKPAAGTTAIIADVSSLAGTPDDRALEDLVRDNINPIRNLSGNFVVWGNRTRSADAEFRYVNVRCFCSYVEASITRGINWVTFEPNAPATWAAVRGNIENFLLQQWRAGALLGTKPEEAFFVRCDRSTLTQTDLDHGRLIALVGIAPVKPAEFVILRIEHATAG